MLAAVTRNSVTTGDNLLPVLEWFTRHWNPLLHEERLPVKTEGDTGWTSLHATRFPPQAIEDDEQRASEWESAWQDWWIRHALRPQEKAGCSLTS